MRHIRTAGFTLIEISLVLLIIAIVLALAVPRLRSISGAELSAQARRLSNTFRYLRSEAILSGQVYQLRYDLNRQRYWAALDPESREEGDAGLGSESLIRPLSLPSPVGISDIVLPETVGKVQGGVVWTNFYPDGVIDTTVIHLDDGRRAYTLWVNPVTGRLFLTQGYFDVDYGR